jgi:hypothetical protein
MGRNMKITVFGDVMPCSLVEGTSTLEECMLLPSSGRLEVGRIITPKRP